jgi:uncharacterized alkaline shock family protein YloU
VSDTSTLSTTTTTSTPLTEASTPTGRTSVVSAHAPAALASSHGRTTIADTVVAKIAGIATREVTGVHALGGGAARAVGALRERFPGGRINQTQGVAVEVGERQAAVDVDLVAEYGVSIADLASAIRRNVIGAVEGMTGLEVTEVNIVVHDIYLEEDDEEGVEEDTRIRVQ